MKTVITLTIEHKKPIPDLLDKVAGRAYTLDGVDDVTASVESGWLPIESAPKDGTRILMKGYGTTQVAGWGQVTGCDFYAWVIGNDVHIEDMHATHWMPLPKAPE